MSRQSKIITAKEFDTQSTISHYESFGWELLSINGNQITMSRETQNPVYTELVKHQSEYETLLQKFKALPIPQAPIKPAPFRFKTWFISLILFVAPCVIYTTYKIIKHIKYKKAFENYTADYLLYNEEKSRIFNKMEEVALESRVIFFSKQN